MSRYGTRELLVGTILCGVGVAVFLPLFWPAVFVFLPPWCLLLSFFRDPERFSSAPAGSLLSPADGTVTDIERVLDVPFIEAPSTRIGIFMSILDVHVNRAPAAGTVKYVQHIPGKCHDARRPIARIENEHNLVGLQTRQGGKLLTNQIAGLVARRIVCPLKPGDTLARGDRIGMVKFGSRVELYIPDGDEFELTVKKGQKVKAGSTVVARHRLPQVDL